MDTNEIHYLPLDDIIPNRFQPREVFEDEALNELASSIKQHGVIQPIIVRQIDNKYEIIAGERRYKASSLAGLTTIPAIIKNLDDKESSKVALLENLQRKDLTSIEEARTYQTILNIDSSLTQESLAQSMGKSQPVIANKLRLLTLPDEVQDALLKGEISERHARSLLNLNSDRDQIELLNKTKTERLTVRELDLEIKKVLDLKHQNQTSTTINSNISENSVAALIEGVELEKNKEIKLDEENQEETYKYQAKENNMEPVEPIIDIVDKEIATDENRNIDDFDAFIKNETDNNEEITLPKQENNNEGLVIEEKDNDEINNLETLDKTMQEMKAILNTPKVKIESIESLDTENNSSDSRIVKQKGMQGIANIVKNTISTLNTSGYVADVEEIDFNDNYQIIIKIDKNSIKNTEI